LHESVSLNNYLFLNFDSIKSEQVVKEKSRHAGGKIYCCLSFSDAQYPVFMLLQW